MRFTAGGMDSCGCVRPCGVFALLAGCLFFFCSLVFLCCSLVFFSVRWVWLHLAVALLSLVPPSMFCQSDGKVRQDCDEEEAAARQKVGEGAEHAHRLVPGRAATSIQDAAYLRPLRIVATDTRPTSAPVTH